MQNSQKNELKTKKQNRQKKKIVQNCNRCDSYKLEHQIRDELFRLQDETYLQFNASIVAEQECAMIGVRIPKLREMAKQIAKEQPMEYLHQVQDLYFEETMLKGLIIGYMKADIQTVLDEITLYVPKITNWALCDTFCNTLKITKKYPDIMWEYLQSYVKSKEPYDIRFAVVMMLCYYINDDYLQFLFTIFDSIHLDHYYVKMAVAWAVSMCYVKYPKETLQYINCCQLDDWTYNKSLQKICESLRVSKEEKQIIRSLKRK